MKIILQVEDDPNDVFFLQHAMKKVGVTNPIHVASDGQQAIDYLRGKGEFSNRRLFPWPALVLLDLKLPHVMGLDVLKWIRQQHGTALAVVMLTASSEQTDIAAAYRFGANGFLVKPSEANKLDEMARAIRDFWLTHNTLPQEYPAESPMEGVVTLGNSLNPNPGTKRRLRQKVASKNQVSGFGKTS
jgi:CheY-like chemotaxis protein